MTDLAVAAERPTGARLSAFSLMLGNFVTGLAVLAPAGMLAELADALSVSIHDAGLLVTFGAVVLCIGSPLMAWATTFIDRRLLLCGTLGVLAVGHALSALAPNYATLLGVRLAMLVVTAIFTPQAASTIALIVPEKQRASAISFVFLGWSLSIAIGLPLVTFAAHNLGWRVAYGALAVAAALVLLLVAISVPAKLKGTPLSLQSWAAIPRNPLIVLLLVITVLWTSGQFMIFPYLGPLLAQLGGATPQITAGFFAIAGTMGFIGNVIASRVVSTIGPFNTSLIFLLSLVVGMTLWSLGAGFLPAMAASVTFLGLGFAALNSMQQARLVAAAPPLASGTIALNTSVLYIGQAVGSGLSGALFANGWLHAIGYVAAAFMLSALGVLALTRR